MTDASTSSDAANSASASPEVPLNEVSKPDKPKSKAPRFDFRASAARLRRALRGGLLLLYTALALALGLAYPALTRGEELLRAHWQAPWFLLAPRWVKTGACRDSSWAHLRRSASDRRGCGSGSVICLACFARSASACACSRSRAP